jgi:hypothetical protein
MDPDFVCQIKKFFSIKTLTTPIYAQFIMVHTITIRLFEGLRLIVNKYMTNKERVNVTVTRSYVSEHC